jgi:hypothetical protein
MTETRATVVLTTIFETPVLETYYANFARYGRLGQVEVVVVPDQKTPPAVFAGCRELSQRGLGCRCPSLEEQEAFLNSVGLPAHLVPYNSDNRRNVGFLMALASGADFLISLDDDNYCLPEGDVFAAHAVVRAGEGEHAVVESPNRFFNFCDLLEFDQPGSREENDPLTACLRARLGNPLETLGTWPSRDRQGADGPFFSRLPAPCYPRGYPYFARRSDHPTIRTVGRAEVHMNAGLWLCDPDVDAITWLVSAPHVVGFKGDSVVLGRNTWSPVNTQNTALRREAIPSYYFVRMGYPVGGASIDRYGDIFSGYFAQACVKQVGGLVRAGAPVADHRRNSHNHLRDATREWPCILVLEDLLPWLAEVKLSGDSHLGAYLSLSHELDEVVEKIHGPIWNEATRGYFHQMSYYMRRWLGACKGILGG